MKQFQILEIRTNFSISRRLDRTDFISKHKSFIITRNLSLGIAFRENSNPQFLGHRLCNSGPFAEYIPRTSKIDKKSITSYNVTT